ncbi:discoidin domain-containing protein [Streptacidiphilus sp. N1-12]|uniref:Discoidin domain-containing protein n=2 Tax=Streptacidiphilus alkalitolerans TaxID=3342712 RepID=A0ABV6VG70_9ACTN
MQALAPPRLMRPPAPIRVAVLAVVAFALFFYALVAGPVTAHAADTLLSQGKTATASSVEGAGLSAANAVDGDGTTRWASAWSDPQWLQVDLGSSYTIDKVVLQWENFATAYQIQVSNDGTNWTNVYSTTTGAGGTETLNVSGTGRYVRMNGTVRTNGYGYSLYEFQVYGAAGATTPPPTTAPPTTTPPNASLLSQGKTATASSVEGAGLGPANAVDGDGTTRWASAWADPQWLEVDLGATDSISQVVLQWENAAKAYQIQVSNDGTNWTNIYTTANSPGGTETLNVSGTGRYVRMYGTVRSNGYGYALYEFKVYGTSGATAPPTTTPPTTTPPTSTPPNGTTPPGNWTPVWSDNFTGAAGSAPSAADWTTDTGTTAYAGGPANYGTSEVETNTNAAANVSVDGSNHLNLTALKDGAGNWTSGRVETKRSDFAAPAGGQLLIQASIKQPNVANGLGYWPAFKAVGAAYRTAPTTWPAVGEGDILEDVNGRSQLSATLHCGTAPNGNCNEYNGLTSGLASCTGCQTGYHTYSEVIDRTKSDEQIRFYLDGYQVWQVNESQVGVATWQAAVDHGFYLQANLSIGGSYPNAVCGCTSPGSGTSSGGTLSIGAVTVAQTTGTAPAPLTDPPVPTTPSVVKVTGSQGNWQLNVNGSPWQVKGVTWGPGTDTANAHMRDLKSMGVNTVRTWGTDATTKPLLDAAAANGLKVINGFWLNQGADYVNDTAYKTSTLNSIVQWVNTYKSHPGVLMWDVGNEVILTTQDHYTGAAIEQQRIAYAQYVEQIVQAIHAADPNHPVTSTDAYTGAWPYYKQYTPDLDLYAVNSYGAVCSVKGDWVSGGYTKPYIVTESGDNGEWEVPNDANGVPTQPTDQQMRDGYTSAWNCIAGHTGVSFGGTMFSYGIENDFGGVWFNLIPEGWKRLAYYSVAKDFGGTPQANTPPVISSMTLSNTSSVAAGGTFNVTTSTTDPDGDLIRYNLMYSTKYVDGGTGLQQLNFTQTGDGQFTVTAPKTLGVWKVYVYASDGHGNVGIETRSFKVVAPPVNGTNVAKGKTTTASSFQATNGNFTPGQATDGDWSTRWASNWDDSEWIQVDLGQTTSIKHIQLGWESAYGKAYQVQVSNDGTNWTNVYSTTTASGGVDDFDVTGSGRYVRLNLTQRGTAYGYSLYEFGVYS